MSKKAIIIIIVIISILIFIAAYTSIKLYTRPIEEEICGTFNEYYCADTKKCSFLDRKNNNSEVGYCRKTIIGL